MKKKTKIAVEIAGRELLGTRLILADYIHKGLL